MARRGVGKIVEKVWKIVGGHKRYVGLDAKGRWKFLKHPTPGKKGTTRVSKTTRKSNPKKGGKTMTKKKRRGGRSLQRTVFKWLRIGSIFAPEIAGVLQKKPAERIIADMVYDKTGYNMADGSWKLERLAKGWGPFFATCLVTYGIPKIVNIIRRL